MIRFDCHSHILPGIDDGAKNIEESLGMLEILENSGVESVLLTPHFYCGNTDRDKLLKEREIAINQLKSEYKGNINLKLACEVGVNFKYSKFADLKDFAIEGTNYILMELPFQKDWSPLGEWLCEFIEETDLTPIIAHVEYYENVLKKPQIIADLVNLGCKIQVNATSFLDENLLPFVKKLLDYNFIDCIGSDSHNLHKRSPKILQCYKEMLSLSGEDCVEKINKRTEMILSNKKFNSPYVKPVKRIFNKYI